MTGPSRAAATTADDLEAVLGCLEDGWLTMGPRTATFEAALAHYLDVEHVISVSSGLGGLVLALDAVGVAGGDVVVAGTAAHHAAAALQVGARPVLVDIASVDDPWLDVAAVEAAIGPETRAVVAHYPGGHPPPLSPLAAACDRAGVVLVEDVEQAVGAGPRRGHPDGEFGSVRCFSFGHLSAVAVGEAGAVATDDPELAQRIARGRSHGMTSSSWDRHRGHAAGYDVPRVGFNFRIDELRAALGTSRIARAVPIVSARRERVRTCREALDAIDGVAVAMRGVDLDIAAPYVVPLVAADATHRERLLAEFERMGLRVALPSQPSTDLPPRCAEALQRHLAVELADRPAARPLDQIVLAAAHRALESR